MTKTYSQIQKQIQLLQREADKVKRKEVDGVIARIREAINAYGLTAADLGLDKGRGKRGAKPAAADGRKPRRAKASTQVKFRDEGGNVWGGRGPRPKWLRDALAAGRQLADFAV